MSPNLIALVGADSRKRTRRHRTAYLSFNSLSYLLFDENDKWLAKKMNARQSQPQSTASP
ncbi:hypothetical protein [Paraburkholderia sediminicola]|uniref:hypothetical protein n=1 Tax=Paraburkholderia sediminicola TaxID=458836 RepID=UPI00105EF200